MKYLLLLCTLAFLIVGCTKHKIKNKCCESSIEITPSSYNKDSVAIWAPQLFTPNGDGINDVFMLSGIGWTMKHIKIKRGLSTVHETSENNWNGAVNGKIKDGYYKYRMEVETIHGETLEIRGAVCAFSYRRKRLQEAEEEKYCECSTGDMIDPVSGFIYGKPAECE